MDRKTFWLSLVAGCFLFLYGIKELYQKGDWVVFMLGLLIIAFSASGIFKTRQK
jgi:hypothetical protein